MGLIDSLRNSLADNGTGDKDQSLDNVKQSLDLASEKLLGKIKNNELDLDVKDIKDLASVYMLLTQSGEQDSTLGTPQASPEVVNILSKDLDVKEDPSDGSKVVDQDDLLNLSSEEVDKMLDQQFKAQNDDNLKANEGQVSLLNGNQLVKATRKMFKLSPDDQVTMDQLNYVLMMSKPSNYIVANHTIRGKPITFNIPDHNINRALAHRPFQVGILNDTYQDVIIIKSRQLGLSELGIEQLIWWLDTHSFDRVNALYTFPTNRQLEDFVAQRLQPEFNHGYYRSLIYDPKSMTLKKMKIRDSNLVFRSSSSGATMEGMDLDYVSLDKICPFGQ